ncbi:MAG: TMEM165/GDT1 family protein [Candidatus Woesearchaeota archaeon]
MLEPLIITFALVLISEIADKSQLVILGLALKYQSPLKIFLIGLTAQVLMDLLAIFTGAFFGFYLPFNLIKIFVAVLFIFLGIWTFTRQYFNNPKKESKKLSTKMPVASLFLTIFLSEFGDKTQITSGLLTAKYHSPILVIGGLVSALALVIAIYVLIGTKLAEKIPSNLINKITATLFILFGLFSLLS